MILEKKVKNNVTTYIVTNDYDDIESKIGTFGKIDDIRLLIQNNADVYTRDEKTGNVQLLLRFRKNVLPKKNIVLFYENMIRLAKQKTKTRGIASGSRTMNPGTNPAIMSNVFGYFDKWPIVQKHVFKTLGVKPHSKVRLCSLNAKHPEEWKNAIPLIQDIDNMYKILTPEHHTLQYAMAEQTGFRIPKTSFTTITTNVNLQTAYHRDRGDIKDGFGNLVVIEDGPAYTGGYTVFPQYGIGVDVRTGDYLAMDVHEVHGNTPIECVEKDEKLKRKSIRLSIVCYLRKNVYEYSKGTTTKDVIQCQKQMEELTKRYMALKGGWLGAAVKGTTRIMKSRNDEIMTNKSSIRKSFSNKI